MDTWLPHWADPVAGLKGLSCTMCLADLKFESDSNFIIGDLKRTLRIYKGTAISWESVLIDVPCAVTCYYPELNGPPNLAVAAGSSIFIYKNSRAAFKFALPAIELSDEEAKVWQDLKQGTLDIADACFQLNSLRDSEVFISARSAELLSYDDDAEKNAFVEAVVGQPLAQFPGITCLGVLQKDLDVEYACSMLVVGTENKMVYVLDQVGSSILRKTLLPSIPVFLNTIGQFTVESRIIVACRDSKVFTIKNGFLMANAIELETPPSSLVALEKYIYVGSYDSKVHCFHMKGRKLYSLYFSHPVTCMSILKLTRTRVFKGLLVGLANGDVKLYKDKVLLSTINLGEPIQGLCFGMYGREEGVLVANLQGGGIVMKKIDKRANFEGRSDYAGPPAEQEVPLNIPSKSKLYLEQADRERENSLSMYKGFLRDLISIKLRTVKAYAKIENCDASHKSLGYNLQMTAFVQGLGPSFSIMLEVENVGKDLPALIPGLKYKQVVELVSLQGASENVRIFLMAAVSALPLMSAFINIPACEDAIGTG
jgi:Bardet-Biedl syndrome 1 protein